MTYRHALVLLGAALGLLTPWIAAGQGDGYVCAYGDLQRRVEIFYEPGRAVPCEVHYYKDTEAPGERQVLWRAQNESGYCESKTRDFIAQLESQGWSCSAGATDGTPPQESMDDDVTAPPVDAPDDEAPDQTKDDTDALVPVAEPETADQTP